MDYQFENLGDERFQQFCQSILARQFPKLQCFPVGQPDGGRDAIAYFTDEPNREFIVFQVKFVRNPSTVSDPHKWLTGILKEEAPKIAALIPKGAKEFYLLTNLAGTSHPGVGSIDRVSSILQEHLPIPSMCWWRADLQSRLDDAWNLQWKYPELLSGTDLLRHLVEGVLTEDADRRSTAVRTFLRYQYELDRDVRFKQVELQNQLLDLFVDVPVFFGSHYTESRENRRKSYLLQIVARDLMPSDEAEWPEHWWPSRTEPSVGAASMLLHPALQKEFPQIVLEGAPGQGKSTIAQYVCQVHRMKLLQEASALAQIPEHHRASNVGIPFRVDLRDLATWLNGQNPFLVASQTSRPQDWQKSLESFLAAQITHGTGGIEFSVHDLHAVVRRSALVLVLDGLDEVADIKARREVVDEILAGVRRLSESAMTLQVIVTSRPAAFANSPGFPESQFPHFSLAPLTRKLIDEYTEKWLKARRLSQRDRGEVKRILQNRLSEPHIIELSRNPMQLAILLSLIHTRGSSLPDKRTALYDSYVGLFFNREAEKSKVVREYRDLLVDIHQYLAWYLHVDSEQGNRRGNISVEKLKVLITDYLILEQQDATVADLLFTGMVERVVALVSRVEGTYEFEVQPLREYFAARHLYETANYSPAGNEKGGTKPDIFDAIVRNRYWLNVTRFYAGCYSKGELSSLVDGLYSLRGDNGYCYTSYPQVLAMTLLSDWVFAQYPIAMKRVIALVTEELGLRHALASSRNARLADTQWSLPKNNGRDELVERCFEILREFPAYDYSVEVSRIISSNCSNDEIYQRWRKSISAFDGKKLNHWLHYGLRLGALARVTLDEVELLLQDDSYRQARNALLFRSRRFDYFNSSAEHTQSAINLILERTVSVDSERRTRFALEQFAQALQPRFYAISFRTKSPVPLAEFRDMEFRRYDLDDEVYTSPDRVTASSVQFAETEKCNRVIEAAKEASQLSCLEWATTIEPWEKVVETARIEFGERWAIHCMANISCGIMARDTWYTDHSKLLDTKISLCRRARYARRSAGNTKWWLEQMEQASSDIDKMLVLLLLVTWASGKTLVALYQALQRMLDNLSNAQWFSLHSAFREALDVTKQTASSRVSLDDLPEGLSHRMVAVIEPRLSSDAMPNMFSKYLRDYAGSDPIILRVCQNVAVGLLLEGSPDWEKLLELIRVSYQQGVFASEYELHLRLRNGITLTPEVAERIAQDSQNYPSYLVALSDGYWQSAVSERVVPVGKTAKERGWFTR